MWWSQFTDLQQIMFIIAITSTGIMLLLLLFMVLGIAGGESFDGGADGIEFDTFNDEPISAISGLKLFTIRGILAFLSVGSWVTFILVDLLHPMLAFGFGFIAGAVANALLSMAFYAAMKLESSGNLDYRKALGKYATVYIRIPKNKQGIGKVTLNHQGRYVEVDAITEESEDLLAKTHVEITGVENDNTLIVKLSEKGE